MTSDPLVHPHGVPVLTCPADGPTLRTAADALDLIGDAYGWGGEVVAVPVERLPDEFFSLSTGLAGEITQKFANYRLRLVIVGDIASHVSGSASLRAFVQEGNRGGSLWFVTSMEELAERLGPANSVS